MNSRLLRILIVAAALLASFDATSGAALAFQETHDPSALNDLRALLERAQAASQEGAHARARRVLRGGMRAAIAQALEGGDPQAISLLADLAEVAADVGELETAEDAWAVVVDFYERTLPPDDAETLRARHELSSVVGDRGDLRRARDLQASILAAMERTRPADDLELQTARISLGSTLRVLGDLQRARELQEQALEVFERTLDPDDRRLMVARHNLASTLNNLGDLHAARDVFESLLASLERLAAGDDPDLQRVRGNLGATLFSLGDLPRAQVLFEAALEGWQRILPEDHLEVLRARGNLALALKGLGELRRAGEIFTEILAVCERVLPPDHPQLISARANLAGVLYDLGDLGAALTLQESICEVRERTLGPDHPERMRARMDLAAMLHRLGDLEAAREHYQAVLADFERVLPSDHQDIGRARLNLGIALRDLGDLLSARMLQESALALLQRALPAEHPAVLQAREVLAGTIREGGDFLGALALQAAVLEACDRTLETDHPRLVSARANMALILADLGELENALTLFRSVLETRERTLPPDHPDRLRALRNVAATLGGLGYHVEARVLEEQVVDVYSQSLPDDHPELQAARISLAVSMRASGDLQGARDLEERAVEVLARILPADHPHLLGARGNVAATLARLRATGAAGSLQAVPQSWGEDRAAIYELLLELCRARVYGARVAVLTSSAREAEVRYVSAAGDLGRALSFAQGIGVVEGLPELIEPAFVLSESTRGAATAVAALTRRAAGHPEYAARRNALRRSSQELAFLAQSGETGDAYQRARSRREAQERELIRLAQEIHGTAHMPFDFSAGDLASLLRPGDAVVAYRTYLRWSLVASNAEEGTPRVPRDSVVETLCAFVARRADAEVPGLELVLVDLGPMVEVENAVSRWRSAIGVGADAAGPGRGLTDDHARGIGIDEAAGADGWSRAGTLRRVVWDPLTSKLQGAERVILLADHALHLVPFDALPAGEGPELLGDLRKIEVRTSLWELFEESRPRGRRSLLVLGEVDFGPHVPIPAGSLARVPWAETTGFSPLVHTGPEAREIAALHREVYGEDAPQRLLLGRSASRAGLEQETPGTSFVHLATHGWFAPDSILSWADHSRTLPSDTRFPLAEGADLVRGMSPMLICGLALADANLARHASGPTSGLMTAEELSTLDLSACELAVLSACDTNLGDRRAGQGVASLQRALHMAGARSAITSLWKVPDEATRVLMLDFYRLMWVEGLPKGQALWEAKRHLREARDEQGRPRYTVRDWGAWVLTGDPN